MKYLKTKIIDIDDDGLNIIIDDKSSFKLFPYKQLIKLNIETIRIQQNADGFSKLYGFTKMKIGSFSRGSDEHEATFDEYSHERNSQYTNITFSHREGGQKYINETDREIGTTTISKSSWDTGANIGIELSKDIYQELYDLVKTRQLSALTVEVDFKNGNDFLYSVNEIDQPYFSNKFAVGSLCFPNGEVNNIEFSSTPLELKESNWGDYGVGEFGTQIRYEDYLESKKKSKSSLMKSLSDFQKLLIAFGVMFIFFNLI